MGKRKFIPGINRTSSTIGPRVFGGRKAYFSLLGSTGRNFASFGDLVCLYDFTRPSTLFTNTGRTAQVSSDGDVIAGVTDLDGTFHLSQSDGTATPTYRTNVLNGRSVARFDGVNDFLQTATNFGTDAGLSGNAVFTVLWVALKSTSNKGMDLGWGNTLAALNGSGMYEDNLLNGYGFGGSVNGSNSANRSTSVWHVNAVTKAAGAINTGLVYRRNGVQVSAPTSTSTPNIRGSDPLVLGRFASSTGTYFHGDIALFALYSGVVSNLSGLENFVNSYVGGIY